MVQVSVIIPCFNAQEWIGKTLRSVLAQELSDMEVIVVDDGSTDNSAALIRREFNFVHLIQTSNQGPSRARNLGTQVSSGEFVQYLDADDVLAEDKLKRQIDALERNAADVAYGDWQELVRQSNGCFMTGRIVTRQIDTLPEIALLTDFWCPPAAYVFRRSIVDKVGGWNEGLPIIQDARFVLDCALHGGRFVYCPGTMAYYRVHSCSSVSTRDPIGFVRDCLRNASEVEEWLARHDRKDEDHRKALLQVYGYVARASFKKDSLAFETAYQALERLKPGYVPDRPRHLAIATRFLGYRRAEWLALWYRKAKRLMK
jgi:glycosyltransferase involved in cell wall biosynthesis